MVVLVIPVCTRQLQCSYCFFLITLLLWLVGSDDEDRTISVRALKAMGEALSKNEAIEDISLYNKELTDEHINAFVAGVAVNQHLRTINLGRMLLLCAS